MQRRVITAVVAIAVVIGALSLFFIFYPTEKKITIVSINDLHGALLSEGSNDGGIVQIAGYIEELRRHNPNTIVIDVGDAFQGRAISNLFYGESVIDCYNAMGIDCLAVGNHEFDWGVDVLKDLMDRADFPFLSANVVYDDLFEPYIVKNIDGVNIQIIGLTTELTPEIVEKKRIEGFQFTDAGEAIKNNYNESCDVVVIAGHMGVEDENSEGFIALKNSGVNADVFLGGHTHEGANWRYDNCTFMEAYAYGTAMGVVNLTIRDSEIVEVSSEVINVTLDYESEMVSDIVNEYYSMVEEEMERVIAYSPSQLRRNSNGESALGNWICDVMRQAFDADVALTNSGGIRADLEPGAVTVGDIFSIMPFDNTVALVELTGSQLREALEIGIATDESGELLHGIVQVSGLNFTYGDDEVIEVYVGGKPLKNNEKYIVATNSFMASGGDGYYIFEEGNNLVDTGVLVRDLLLQYAEASGKIEARVEGRIRKV